MSIYLNEDETQRCSGYREGNRGSPLINKPALRSGDAVITYAKNVRSFAAAWARILAISWQSQSTGGLSSSRVHKIADDSDTAQRSESHLCVEKFLSPTHDTELLTLGSMESMEDDFQLFVSARRMLGEAEGSWARQLLPWSYHQVVLVRVGLKSSQPDPFPKMLTTA